MVDATYGLVDAISAFPSGDGGAVLSTTSVQVESGARVEVVDAITAGGERTAILNGCLSGLLARLVPCC